MEKIRDTLKIYPKDIYKPFIMLFFCFCFSFQISFAQNQVLDVGVRLQKTVNLYYENGFTVQYANDLLLSGRLYLGATYVSSRFGSAFLSNALEQDNFFLSATYYFRPQRVIQPFIRLNTGYFISDLEEAIFEDLPNSSILLSPEFGVGVHTGTPLKINASFGYNTITGNGISGPGTLYPLFVQTSITWNLLKK